MAIEDSLYSELASTTALTAIVGTKIYPGIATQGIKMPYVCYSEITSMTQHAMDKDVNLNEAWFQISAYSTSYLQGKSISRAVRSKLKDFSGTLGGGVSVQRCFFDSSNDFTDIDSETDKITHHIQQDFTFWYTT